MSAPLLTSVKVGDLTLKNRIIMAALTRTRADPKTGIATPLHAEYYAQRANAGLILTECSQISPDSLAFPGSAGIHSDEQVTGWKLVTDAVHKAGSYIFLQIWHGGRAVPKEFSGQDPVAPSAIGIKGKYHSATGEQKDHTTPRELTLEEIKAMIENFRKGAENAKNAGFDGVELHAANGYIVHQFLTSNSNHRTDEYGGSVENRCRFALEVTDQLISVFGKDRVGIKISPVNRYNDMCDANPLETYQYLLTQLSAKGIAFVEVCEASDDNLNDHPAPKEQMPEVAKTLRPFFKGTFISNKGITYEKGNAMITEGITDACSFGTLHVSNPDLVKRFENGWPTASPNWATVYGPTAEGYTDYPIYVEPKKEVVPEPEKPNEAEEQKSKPEPEQPKAVEVKVEETKVAEPEKPKEVPKVDETKVAEPEKPKEEPKVAEPEKPKEAPKVEEQKVAEPEKPKEVPKAEEPKVAEPEKPKEAPKVEEIKAVEPEKANVQEAEKPKPKDAPVAQPQEPEAEQPKETEVEKVKPTPQGERSGCCQIM